MRILRVIHIVRLRIRVLNDPHGRASREGGGGGGTGAHNGRSMGRGAGRAGRERECGRVGSSSRRNACKGRPTTFRALAAASGNDDNEDVDSSLPPRTKTTPEPTLCNQRNGISASICVFCGMFCTRQTSTYSASAARKPSRTIVPGVPATSPATCRHVSASRHPCPCLPTFWSLRAPQDAGIRFVAIWYLAHALASY